MPTLVEPFNLLLKKLYQAASQAAGRKLQAVAEGVVETVLVKLSKRRQDLNRGVDELYQQAVRLCKEVINGPPICIEVESRDIRNRRAGELIKAKARFSRPLNYALVEVDCYLSCGHWEKLGDLKADKINLMDHLEKLLPPFNSSSVGLVTFQNGIMNSFAGEFKTMGQQIVNQFPEGPLCIGLHNPTTRIIVLDMFRFADEGSLNERAVYSLCQLFKTLADRLPTKNPKMKWAHFAHSEGGLIGNAALTLCSESWLTDTRRFLKNNVMTFTYGAVKPIPNEPVLKAINTYSTKDIALI